MSDERLAQIEASIRALMGSELGIDPELLKPDTRLTELGVSSVKVLRLVAKIERMYEIELSDDVIFRADSLRDLAILIAECTTRPT
jgi:acyl carrier protein